MFVDKAKIHVKGGDGGNGAVAFRREKYVPHGGPSGGDGGKGGDIVFKVDKGLKTLLDFKANNVLKAEKGEHGGGRHKHGKNGKDLIVNVPPGTVVKGEDEDKSLLCDLTTEGETFVVARGGKGGRGNAKFVTSKNRAPKMAEKGEPGEEKKLILELSLVADVGLIGFPNAGKSTLLSVVSKAAPKIADYPFTTISPNLGVCENSRGDRFTIADIPGIIEGAHEGRGMGYEFLRHVERNRLLVYILDMSGFEDRDPVKDFKQLRQELSNYGQNLVNKPTIVAANKMDIGSQAEYNLERFNRVYGNNQLPVFPISCISRYGLDSLLSAIGEKLQEIPCDITILPGQEVMEQTLHANGSRSTQKNKKEEPVIEKKDSTFVVKHRKLEEIATKTDFENEEAYERFQRIIEKMELEKLLKEKGIEEGDVVKIGKIEFEFYE